MKNFAKLDAKNIVENIIITEDDFNEIGYVEYNQDNPAQIGFLYNAITNTFDEVIEDDSETK
jgi:hypothetical protein